MKVPISNRMKALVIIDVQPAFLNNRNRNIVENIIRLINGVKYDLYVEAVFHAEKDSLWDKQQNWICPKDDQSHTVDELREEIKDMNVIRIEKKTKSVFKGNKDLFKVLKEKNIEELHIVGTETNDCVLASAYESFDLGFFTYVIEECCQSRSSDELHQKGLDLLRKQHSTNNSCIEEVEVIDIS